MQKSHAAQTLSLPYLGFKTQVKWSREDDESIRLREAPNNLANRRFPSFPAGSYLKGLEARLDRQTEGIKGYTFAIFACRIGQMCPTVRCG